MSFRIKKKYIDKFLKKIFEFSKQFQRILHSLSLNLNCTVHMNSISSATYNKSKPEITFTSHLTC